MKSLGLLLLVLSCLPILAQEHPKAEWTTFPPSERPLQSVQGKQLSGCDCVTDKTALDEGIVPREWKDLQVSPLTATAHVGEPVRIRFDGSYICNGQTDLYLDGKNVDAASGEAGTAKWEETVEQGFPDTFGYLVYGKHDVNGSTVVGISKSAPTRSPCM